MKTIAFYKVNEPYGWMSNFAPYPIELEGKVWPTSEHYFQAGKFPGSDYAEAIRGQRSPMIAARMGRSRDYPIRADWEAVKEAVMRAAVLAKFSQHADLRALLLATGDALLVEHTANDSYWADGGDGSGLNRLGVILMDVRAQLRNLSRDS
jgi:N-glycosidase YbiA